LVVEAAIRSGSLITAKYAMEQGREVFAIPGSIHSPMSKGCHALIKQGAKLVEEMNDIIEEIIPFQQLLTKLKPQPTADSATINSLEPILLQYIGYEVTAVDTIAQRSLLPINEVLYQLLSLELQGDVASMPGGYMRLRQI
jgi:DNA processing protein